MNIDKTDILSRICYTELVYDRINKKLDSKFSKSEIEKMLFDIVKETQETFFTRIGKNIYVTSSEKNIKITINSNTYRVITVDKLNKTKYMDKEVGKLKFMCSLITVADIKKSRDFYENVLGQKVEADYGENVSFGGFAIHLLPHWKKLIDNKDVVVGGNNFELYFEYDNLEQIVEKLKAQKVEFIHELQEAPWRQLGVKFYDPDRNIIEIGETLEYLTFRLYQQGNSFDEISKLTGLSREFIEKSVQNQTEQ